MQSAMHVLIQGLCTSVFLSMFAFRLVKNKVRAATHWCTRAFVGLPHSEACTFVGWGLVLLCLRLGGESPLKTRKPGLALFSTDRALQKASGLPFR